ncbi:hypothetical protein G7048_23680 [Diaphorobacter sp. HDW4B]|uniref:hypothetical protein n=1 Tax=Diaphorobacter sp. HDW4B TaxID=2714925 RepID=UPI00140E24C0|nr:hypothetical protein [Diaphorobacter sp. HDW4B]QIL73089.1 hypothetical protein G7048_23680 [Diaphorobacter sp. HDW4B]
MLHTPRDCHASSVKPIPALLFVAMGLLTQAAHAQATGGKTVIVEPTSAPVAATAATTVIASPFVSFGQWIEQVVTPVVLTVSAPVTLQEFIPPVATPAPAPSFEAAPVILGQPELPLLGQAAAQAAQQWNTGLNYQGLTVSYVVLDAAGQRREVRPVSKGIARGERFKVRYATSFESVAAIDQVVGDSPWRGQRTGQVWPRPGTSVQSNPGEVVELPLEPNAYFKFGGAPNERYVLTIRHPRANAEARSSQPVYRQDGARGSQYLQLVPEGSYPAIEQVVTPLSQR